MTPEQKARKRIDALLHAKGWQWEEEVHTGRRTGAGFADYVLLDGNNQRVALLEAKSRRKPALTAKEQAREYADSLGLTHVFLSNGREHYHWNTASGEPQRIHEFPTPEELTGEPPTERTSTRNPICDIQVDKDYLKNREMRDYQVAALRAIQEAAATGQTGFLIEMATGTGKTTVAAAICRLWLQSGRAQRILFLVDRKELYEQAITQLREALENQYEAQGFYEEKPIPNCPITVATIQALDAAERQRKETPPDYYQLIISDEAHRSVSGPSRRELFNRMVGDKIGLTATPRQFATAPTESQEEATNPWWEASQFIRDTYHAFSLTPGQPTYEYRLEEAAQDGHLVLPRALDIRTEVTKQLLSEEGYLVFQENEESGAEEVKAFHEGSYGKQFLSPDTNREFAEQIIQHARREPETDLIGKTIVYCSTTEQASLLTQELNTAASAAWPARYNSDFAVQITHQVDRATDLGRNFAGTQGLLGRDQGVAQRQESYRASKARVCVTVAMMTTGYDCPDLLNIAFCRPVKSLVDYIQMKRRGTRKYDFTRNFADQAMRDRLPPRPKEEFLILDFFGVCEHFGEGRLYAEVSRLPEAVGLPAGVGGTRLTTQYIHYGTDDTVETTRLTLDADHGIITRQAVESERERERQDLSELFEEYWQSQHTEESASDRERQAAEKLFRGYATNPDIRTAIRAKEFGRLSAPLTIEEYLLVPEEHRQAIPPWLDQRLDLK